MYTSTITVAECTHFNESIKDISEEEKRLIKSILTSGRICRLVQTHLYICELSRDIAWNDGVSYKGADGIHLASAIDSKCTEFFTNDRLIKKIKNIEVFREKYNLELINPFQTSLLPSDYKQNNLPLKIEAKKNDEKKAEEN